MRLLKRGSWSTQYNAIQQQRDIHPLDVVEFKAELHHVEYDRPSKDELYFFHSDEDAPNYEESLIWYEVCETLAYSYSLDLYFEADRLDELRKLITHINGHLMSGHFDFIPEENILIFRYALLLQGGADITSGQCAAILDMGPKIYATHHQAFMLVANTYISAEEALKIAIFDVKGRA